jgi:hypothetical protein
MVDYGMNRGNTKLLYACSPVSRTQKATRQNRECISVDMCWGLDGFQYGLHVIVGRKTVTQGQVPDRLQQFFTNETHELFKSSTHGLHSTTDCGIQTGASFLRRLEKLVEELKQRGVPFPIVIVLDDHSSRKVDFVMEFCKANQIWLCTEPAASSGWLQALDQYNKKCHEAYKKALRVWKANHAGGDDESVNIGAFYEILTSFWLTWSSPVERMNAFRKVGISATLDPSAVDTGRFKAVVEQQALISMSSAAAATELQLDLSIPEGSMMSPDGTQKQQLEYFKLMHTRALKVIAMLHATPMLPSHVLPKPNLQKDKPDRSVIEADSGSFDMRELVLKGIELREQKESKAEQVAARREEREDRREEEEAVRTGLVTLWKKFNKGAECQCNGSKAKECSASGGGHYCKLCDKVKPKPCRAKHDKLAPSSKKAKK